jgi:RNA polymerase sigma factor (sigma-70 family)
MFRKSDRQIVRRVLAGRREEYGILVERYGAVAKAVAYSRAGNGADAEDATQDAFLTAFLRLDTLRDASSFGPWLLTIVRHAAGKLAARHRREHEDLATQPVPVLLPDLEERDLHEQVRAKVMDLEESAREILLLYYFAGNNTREIAKLLGLTSDAVEKRLQRARAQVGAALLRELGGDIETRSAVAARRQRVMGIVGTVAVPWSSKAAGGILGGLFTAAAAKPVVAGTTAVLVGALAVTYTASRPSFRADAPPPAASASTGGTNSSPARPGSTEAAKTGTANDSAAPPATLLAADGPGRILGRTLDENERPVANAEITLTETDWLSYDPPAAPSHPRTFKSDASGRFDIGGLPLRPYGLIARSGALVGVSGASLSKEEPEEQLEFTLLPAAHVAGRVVDGKGQPIAHAWVVPIASEGDGHFVPHSDDGQGDDLPAGMAKILGAWTDDDGRFRIEGLHPGRYRVAARADGFAWAKSPLNPVNSDSVEVKLKPESRIAGQVVDASGQSVSEADVTLDANADLLGPARVHTGGDGTFAFSSLDAGPYELTVAHDTMASVETPVKVELGVAEAKTGLALKTDVGASVAGRVVDADTGRGIAGILVGASSRASGECATTDADGQYRLTGIGPGECDLNVDKAWGYKVDQATRTTLTMGQVVEGMDFRLSRGTVVSGRVLDAAGSPVARAKVLATRENRQEAFAMTGPDGTFTLSGFGLDEPLRLYAAKDRMIAQSEELSVPHEGLTGISLTLEPGACLRGRVLDAAGNRVRYADLRIEPESGRFFLWGEISYSALGNFDARGLLPGDYAVSVAIKKDRKEYSKPVQVTLEAGNTVDDLVLTASRATPDASTYTVEAAVVDESGRAVEGVQVWASDSTGSGSPHGVSNADGLIRVENVPGGTYSVWADGAGFRAEPVQVKVPATLYVRLVGTRGGRIEGRVVGPGGKPLREFSVLATRNGAAWAGLPLKAPDQASKLLSESGSFSITAEPNSNGVAVWAAGFTPALAELPDMTPGQKRAGLVVRLEPETLVAGRVVGPDGRSVTGAVVFARALPQEESPQDELLPSTGERETLRVATTNAEGRFEARGLPATSFRLWAYDERYLTAAQIVTPVPGRTAKADFVLETGGRVEGTVTLGGKPAQYAEVFLNVYGPLDPPGPGFYSGPREGHRPVLARERVNVDGQGHFAAGGLPPGSLEVRTSVQMTNVQGGRTLSEVTSIEAGQTVRVNHAFADDGAELSSTVTVGGAPAVSGSIGLERSDGLRESIGFFAKNGVFRCTGLPAGTWQVSVTNATDQAGGYHNTPEPLTVEMRPHATTHLDIALP